MSNLHPDIGMETSSMVGSSAASNSESVGAAENLKRKSDDIGWEYGELVNPSNLDKVKCKLCSKVVSGGIYRLKHHIARIKGMVASCNKSTPIDQAKCKQALQGAKKRKDDKRDQREELQNDVDITEITDHSVEIDGSSRMRHSLGPMDSFARPISPMDTSVEARKKMRQQNINDTLFLRNNIYASMSAAWWSNYGSETPNLQRMAMKILSLTTSSSGCERNWSTFESIHTKKRNRLDANRMSKLVYVQFNSKLSNKKKKMKEKYDILLADNANMAQGWIVEGGNEDDIESEDSTSITDRIFRDLDEDNFESEDEEPVEDFVFEESDHEYW